MNSRIILDSQTINSQPEGHKLIILGIKQIII